VQRSEQRLVKISQLREELEREKREEQEIPAEKEKIFLQNALKLLRLSI
jgi:predicted TIM-barrel fold metal-dependent hydrolase